MAGPRWQAIAALIDPVRRALYDYVRRQDHPVTREEAAEVRSVSRNLAAFHLDKLVDAGLLRARYEAPADQPRGRGRTPKVYEPAGDGLALTIPQRRYELVGEILTDAIAEDPTNAGDAAQRLAFDRGRRMGESHGATDPDTGDPTAAGGGEETAEEEDLAVAGAALADLGFDPRPARPSGFTLHNCPFHALAVRQPALVCGLNQAFVSGVLVGLGVDRLTARLAPLAGACCVAVDLD